MIIFNGVTAAAQKEAELTARLARMSQTSQNAPTVLAVLFREDAGSRLYTQFKRDSAERIGIKYQVFECSVLDTDTEAFFNELERANTDDLVTGIIIQKPRRSTWVRARSSRDPALMSLSSSEQRAMFNSWWHGLTVRINPLKDVDGLHPDTLQSIQNGTWRQTGQVLPATCRAVLQILEKVEKELDFSLISKKVIILGKTDLLGLPLFYELKNQGVSVELLASGDFQKRIDAGAFLFDADVLVSATGKERVVTGTMVKEGVVVIDVGEPRPDVDRESVQEKAAFLTPVPGGVGPMTIVCLLENTVDLRDKQIK